MTEEELLALYDGFVALWKGKGYQNTPDWETIKQWEQFKERIEVMKEVKK